MQMKVFTVIWKGLGCFSVVSQLILPACTWRLSHTLSHTNVNHPHKNLFGFLSVVFCVCVCVHFLTVIILIWKTLPVLASFPFSAGLSIVPVLFFVWKCDPSSRHPAGFKLEAFLFFYLEPSSCYDLGHNRAKLISLLHSGSCFFKRPISYSYLLFPRAQLMVFVCYLWPKAVVSVFSITVFQPLFIPWTLKGTVPLIKLLSVKWPLFILAASNSASFKKQAKFKLS